MTRPDPCSFLIKQIHDELEKRANNSLREKDLTLAQMGALFELKSSPEKQKPLKELERLLHIAQSTAAGIAVRLEQKGFVESFGDTNDRRIKMIRITPAGEECCQQAEKHMHETESLLLSKLTETEKLIFSDLLKKIFDSLK
ncbi:MAG: MarR family transcriptional regulator [Firmicutes bacterium]|nr:MarR family transcriptional regulator [Bacillota bacterium]